MRKIIDMIAKWIHTNQEVFIAFVAIALIGEVFILPYSADTRLFGGVFLYWWLAHKGKLTSIRVFQLCLVLLVAMALSYLTSGAVDVTERLAVWFVLFFALGIIKAWRETAS